MLMVVILVVIILMYVLMVYVLLRLTFLLHLVLLYVDIVVEDKGQDAAFLAREDAIFTRQVAF